MLLVVVPGVTVCWHATNGLLGKYFAMPHGDGEVVRSAALLMCLKLDSLPPLVLLTVATAGATLAAINWREGLLARICAAAHVTVFGIAAYTLLQSAPP